MRNLLLIHLESLNYSNYRINHGLFPNLSDWEKKSLSFSKYFSTATSTLMVVGDLAYGGMLQYEACESLDFIPEKYIYSESLFDSLQAQGYETNIFVYPEGGDREGAGRRHIVGARNEMKLIREYKDYIREVDRAMKTDGPFALMLCNYISNVSLNQYIPEARFESGLDRWKSGYQALDVHVGDIMHLLETKGILNCTTVIFYGDHGDEYFAHGGHQGLTHAIEPYADLIHTPFWIYDERLQKDINCRDLLTAIDIKNIAEKLLSMPEERLHWNMLNIPLKKYMIARNAYAAQPVRAGSFNKGYSLTDGRFLLLVSNYGLEMYNIEMDIHCQTNLLKLFVLRQDILYLNKELNDSLGYHYRSIINMSALRQIRQIFYYYRKRLYEDVEKLYRYAGNADRIKELQFDQIHYS